MKFEKSGPQAYFSRVKDGGLTPKLLGFYSNLKKHQISKEINKISKLTKIYVEKFIFNTKLRWQI